MSDDKFGDQRLKKDSTLTVRGSRDTADAARTEDDGGSMTAAQRRQALRQDWVQEVLPTPPKIPGFHCCWLSTTNSTDPIYKRMQRGYLPVKTSEVPGFAGQYSIAGGEFDGGVACNEMILFKINEQTYNDLMTIYHHDLPIEQEASIREGVDRNNQFDSNGRPLGEVEGDFNRLGRTKVAPTFI